MESPTFRALVLFHVVITCVLLGTSLQSKPVVVIVPDFGGIRVEARVDPLKNSSSSSRSAKKWFTMWLDPLYTFVWHNCLSKNFLNDFRLVYDPVTNTMVDREGVETRIFGSKWSPDCLEHPRSKFIDNLTPSLNPVVKHLVNQLNYIPLVDLFVAPYDFRSIGDGRVMSKYFSELDVLIKEMASPFRRKVLLISQGVGGPLVAHYLGSHNQSWKDRLIDSWYSISGIFGGSFAALQAYVTGLERGYPTYLTPLDTKKLFSSFPTTLFMMPSRSVFNDTQVIMTCQTQEYLMSDLDNIIYTFDTSQLSKVAKHIPDPFVKQSPGVPMACVYGSGMPTTSGLMFPASCGGGQLEKKTENGDGYATTESLSACLAWSYMGEFETKQFRSGFLTITGQTPFLSHLDDFIKRRTRQAQKVSRVVGISFR